MIKIISNKYSILLVLVYIIFLNPKIASANSLVFEDDFSQADGIAHKWGRVGDTGWNVSDGEYGIRLSPGLSNTVPKDEYWNFDVDNIMYEVDIRGVAGTDKNILVKFQNPSRFVEVHHTGGKIGLAKSGVGRLDREDYPLINGLVYNFKIFIEGDHIKVYVKKDSEAEFSDEPLLEATESGYIMTDWKVGLRAGTGNVKTTEVWFDNVKVTSFDPETGPFELPFEYDGRNEMDEDKFKTAFWSNATAFFDHQVSKDSFVPFTGDEYKEKCKVGKSSSIECYNGHNGTDFSKSAGEKIFSVSEGTVVYSSKMTPNDKNCIPAETRGLGCVVIVDHSNGLFSLYAHLDKITTHNFSPVDENSQIGVMGSTGKATGKHLHFGVLRTSPTVSLINNHAFSRDGWGSLIAQLEIEQVVDAGKSKCSYPIPEHGVSYKFSDPAGWSLEDIDPYSLPQDEGGCRVESTRLWKYPVN